MQNLDWDTKQRIAKAMTNDGLIWAMMDCREAAAAMGTAAMIGKDAGYYMDELSVYKTELEKRRSG